MQKCFPLGLGGAKGAEHVPLPNWLLQKQRKGIEMLVGQTIDLFFVLCHQHFECLFVRGE
jgi:hypothetical protein